MPHIERDEFSHCAFVPDTTVQGILGWKDRMDPWARFRLPLTPKSFGIKETPLDRLQLPVEPPSRLQRLSEDEEIGPDTKSPHPGEWAEGLEVSTKAHFGRLLHSIKSPLPSIPPKLLTMNHPRVFAPTTPHPLQLAKFETENAKTTQPVTNRKTVVVVRFWPAPIDAPSLGTYTPRNIKQHSKPPPPGPLLELRLTTSGGKVQGIESFRAIKQTHNTDVMLPLSLVDLRFSQTQSTALQGDPADLIAWQPIADFLGAARIDLAHDKLKTPPRQAFPIPRRLFNDPAKTHTRDADKLIDTEYMLASLEVHRSVSIPYGVCELTYISVDARQGGGRWAEVTLEPRSDGRDVSAVKEDTYKLHDEFLATCHRFAQDDNLWSGYTPAICGEPPTLTT